MSQLGIARESVRVLKKGIVFGYSLVPGPIKRSIPADFKRKVRNRLSLKPLSYKSRLSKKLLRLYAMVEQSDKLLATGKLEKAIASLQTILKEPALKNDPQLQAWVNYNLAAANKLKNGETITGKTQQKNKVAVFTALSGDYDQIKLPLHYNENFDYFAFTDLPIEDFGVWNVAPLDYFSVDKARAARYVKTHAYTYFKDYDYVIWVDASVVITGDIEPLLKEFIASQKQVGFFPHPHRSSYIEEADACTRLNKDEEETIETQVARYQAAGFEHSGDLGETGVMIFKMQDSETTQFLKVWWSEIENGSRRDQISLNFALHKAGASFHFLSEKPINVRNHPLFGLLPHGKGEGVAKLYNLSNKSQTIDPFSEKGHAVYNTAPLKSKKTVEVVVCVYNALPEVTQCLNTIAAKRTYGEKLIIVDDCSQAPTHNFLKQFVEEHDWAQLLVNSQRSGYTKTANRGLKASESDITVLLNSDTVVTENWVEKIVDVFSKSADIGIVGPLSNAASHQSIPNHQSGKGQTAVNELPANLSADDMNKYCEKWSHKNFFPKVPLVHGFCFAVSKDVLETIGYLDEESFPMGYGEENDFCFRAIEGGFELAVATNIYIFHHKSKSYVDEERQKLMKAGSAALLSKYGRKRLNRSVLSMHENHFIEDVRKQCQELYSQL